MELAGPLIELVNNIWGLVRKPLGYIYNLRVNVTTLRKEAEELKVKSRDVEASVEHEERGGGVRRKDEVDKWLGDVREFEGRVDRVLREAEERDRIRCLSRCLPRNCWSSYRSGETVNQMLNEARDLQKKKGEFGVLMLPLPPPPVIGMPMGETVGLDTSLDDVWKCLVDEEKGGVIGLYGLGGVGKTTLMEKIKEKISPQNPEFQPVIWVVVSRQVNKEAIQDTIRKRLGIVDGMWNGWDPKEKDHHLCHALTKKKFLLLLDDLWAMLDLRHIGVPGELPNGSKIVFTTREKQICYQMGAEKSSFEVQCLTKEEALKLFEKKAGESTVRSHPEIRELANKIVDECKGLPLALITVGRAMAGIHKPPEWEHALKTLRRRPHKLSGMEEEVYHVLEFSYDSLNDSTLQRCFLYCCLFPEDYHMRPHDLIRLWIGEGLLGDIDVNDVYSLRIEGEHVLERLNRACLLESGHDDGSYVKMHDVIRDMAMWIARDHGQKENKWLVIEREENLSTKMISKREDAEKITLWGKGITSIIQIPSRCSQLVTLIVRETYVQHVPRGFFDSMATCLTVLDLSNNRKIHSLPGGICNLINLQHLNLSGTSIQKLPSDIDKLTQLRFLLLEYMVMPILIPIRAIPSLPLRVLSTWKSWPEEEEEMVEELGHMQYLDDLFIEVNKSSSVHKIFQSLNFQGSIRRMEIKGCLDLTCIVVGHSLLHLELLILRCCRELVQMEINEGIGRAPNCSCFPSLTKVEIFECVLLDLSWLVHAPKLRELTVTQCQSMEKIIGDGFAPGQITAWELFSCLEYVRLFDLPKLTSICDKTLSFSQGVRFNIFKCPGLRKLPLDSNNARGGSFSVEGDEDWWAGFEWDPAVQVTFKSRWHRRSRVRVEEITYGEAQRRMKGRAHASAEIGFRPHGLSE